MVGAILDFKLMPKKVWGEECYVVEVDEDLMSYQRGPPGMMWYLMSFNQRFGENEF
jgi:hypothetical protein